MKTKSRLEEVFSGKGAVYMAHVYYGDPAPEFSDALIKALTGSGVDIVEFGIPFSDPTSDGPVFQRACERSLKGGMTPGKAIEGIAALRRGGLKAPVVVTTYYNIVFRMGEDRFTERIKEAGADALIVPDVPCEEAGPLLEAGRKNGIEIIFLVAPTTPERRLKEILKIAQGFVYVVSVTGVTGARESVEEETIELVRRVRKHSEIPVLVGFGISRPEHARSMIGAGADGVITGSAISRIYEKHIGDPMKAIPEIEEFAKSIKGGCTGGPGGSVPGKDFP